MSVTIPATHVNLDERDTAIYRGRDILATQLIALADNANHAYALGARRTALSMHDIDVTADASYVVIAKVPFTFAAGREAAGLQLVYGCTNADVRVTVRDATDASTLGTLTDATGTVVTSGTITGVADADVIIKVEAQEHSGAGGTLDMLHVYELAHDATTLPNVVAISDVAAVQIAAGMNHVWTFDNAGTPTEDLGVTGGATLTVVGTVTSQAPTATGSRGIYYQATNGSSSNRVKTGTNAVRMERTSDCWFEGVVTCVDPFVGNYGVFSIGKYPQTETFGWISVDSSGYARFYYSNVLTFSYIQLTSLTDTYLAAGPTYIGVWWDHSASVFRIYANNGTGELTFATGVVAAGSGTTGREVVFGGDGATFYSAKAWYHAAAFHRGALTSTHRNNIYAALGF